MNFNKEHEQIERIRVLKAKFRMLKYSQKLGNRLDFYSWHHPSRHPVFQQFIKLLNEFGWMSEAYRWDDKEEDYYDPEKVLARPHSFDEALKNFRYLHRCERVMEGSLWPTALDMDIIDWGLSGLATKPWARIGSFRRAGVNII